MRRSCWKRRTALRELSFARVSDGAWTGVLARSVLGMLPKEIAYGTAIRAAKREQDDRPSQNRHV